MRVESLSYPIPVFGAGDDVTLPKPPAVALESEVVDATLMLRFSGLKVVDEFISRILETGQAAFVARVQSRSTLYRQVFRLTSPEAVVKLAATSVHGRVEVSVNIVALQRIERYRPVGIHEDYGDAEFGVEAGDLIGILGEFVLEVDHGFDAMNPRIGSILRVAKSDLAPEGRYRVHYELDRIKVEMHPKDWAIFNTVRAQMPSALHSALVLPVLTEAVRKVISEELSEDHYRWVGRVKTVLQRLNMWDERPAVEVAQAILDGPFPRMGTAIDRLLNVGE